jgi:glutamine synthetase
VPDGACNPYLAAAVLLHACRLGVEQSMALQPRQPVGEAPQELSHVPENLEAAIEAMLGDAAICEALGAPLVNAFCELKRAEWKRYVEAVKDPATTDPTQWELDYYTPFF